MFWVDLLHEAIERLAASFQCDNLLGLVHDFFGKCVFDSVSGDQHSILGIGCPTIEQLSRHTTLKHTGTGKDHRGTPVVKGIDIDRLEVANVFKGKGISHVHLGADARVHHVGIGLIDSKCTGRQFGCVPNGNALQVWVGLPKLVQYKQQFLGSSQSKDRDETPSAPSHDPLNGPRKTRLSFGTTRMNLHPIGSFHHEHIRFRGGYFGGH
eukprot:scaffold323220_cov55-Attheya_sp.AAC.1